MGHFAYTFTTIYFHTSNNCSNNSNTTKFGKKYVFITVWIIYIRFITEIFLSIFYTRLERRHRYVVQASWGAPAGVITLDEDNPDAAAIAKAKVKGVTLTYPLFDKATHTYSNPWRAWDPKLRTNAEVVKWWLMERDPFGVPGSKVRIILPH
jgi:hypothetical protein